MLFAGHAQAQVACASAGDVPPPYDPALPPKIASWAARVEAQTGLVAANWRGPRPAASTPAQAELLEVQAMVRAWASSASERSGERFFREAVVHGVNVQYEQQMVRDDPRQAETHRLWVNVEAARAEACLTLVQPPP